MTTTTTTVQFECTAIHNQFRHKNFIARFFVVVLLNDTLFSLVCMLLFYGMLPTLCHVLLNIDVVTLFRIVNIISTSDDEHGNLTPYTH